MALPSGPVVLPFKSQKVSFSLSYRSDAAPSAQVELACVCFGRDADVLDFVTFNRRAALNSALKHSACSYLPAKEAVQGADESIHMYPFDFSPQCEVMLLLASAPHNPFLPNDLSTSRRLQYRVHAQELGAAPVQLLDADLSPLVEQPARRGPGGAAPAAAAGALSSGHQTMVIGGVYTTPQGWTLSMDCSTFPEDHWGLLLPQLRTILQRWPSLSAATAAAQAGPRLQQQVVIGSRRGSDSAVADLYAALAGREAAAAAAAAGRRGAAAGAAQDEDDARAEDGATGGESGAGDGQLAAEASGEAALAAAGSGADARDDAGSSGGGAASAGPAGLPAATGGERLMLDVGWQVFRPQPLLDDGDGEEDEDEEAVVDFALSVYNLQGDEIVTLNIDNPVFDGINIEDEPAEDELEAEEDGGAGGQPDAPAAAEAAAGGTSPADAQAPQDEQQEGTAAEAEGSAAPQGGGDDDDDGFVKEDDSGGDDELKEESPEAKAARVAAGAEAAAAAAQAAAANQRPLAERFPLKRRVQLSLAELPADARAMVLTMTCFSAGGFKNVKTLQTRLVLAAPKPQDPAEEGGEQDAGGEAAAQHKRHSKRQPDKVLMHYRFDSVQGADAHLTQLLALKLYKEYPDSAFAVWARAGVPDVAALLGCEAAVAAAAAAAAATAPAVPGAAGAAADCAITEKAKEVLQQVLAARKQLEADLAARKATAEEEGLDLEEEEEGAEHDLRLARGVWRVRVLGMTAGGGSPEDMAPLISNLLAYDGDLDAGGARASRACKVAYPNRDTYFGPYAAGAKAGVGLYVAASGAAYAGQYAAGRRAGFGLMVLPDGGLYKGGFRDDRFEGQGTYLYPDHSLYTGSWRAGRKHGQGTYWDSAGGCLRGEWAAGQLRGQAQYDQPAYHFEGRFARGLPAGPCSFALSSEFRTAGLPAAAASHVVAPHGPTLRGEGRYLLPPGVHAGEAEAGEGEDAPEPVDGAGEEGSEQLPSWPAYEGLAYRSGSRPPCSVADVPFPPPAAPLAAI